MCNISLLDININAPGTDVNMLVDNKISYKKFVVKQESTTSLGSASS